MFLDKKLDIDHWRVDKIAVIGAGIVGVPMAALLAQARICQGSLHPASVALVQRNSPTSGWKVEAINAGRSPIGGIEPGLEKAIAQAVSHGWLRASHDYSEARDADVVLICVQTDKDGFQPEYGPLCEAIDNLSCELRNASAKRLPLIIFESTLAPSSMATIIKDRFAQFGLLEGRDMLLGNSPNRVMPGHLIERVRSADKIVGGLSLLATQLISQIYSSLVTRGKLHLTNSLTAEIVKTLENAYRDVRIAFSAETARYCDAHDIDYYHVRDEVNKRLASTDQASQNPNTVPSGGMMIPTIGVGGHCLPKDGILLLWRKIESEKGLPSSVILEARRINEESPAAALGLIEKAFGSISGMTVALMGVAYRFNSEDTRNSPSFVLAQQLLDKGCKILLHDPYVRPGDRNLVRCQLEKYFTKNLNQVLDAAELMVYCTAHRTYLDEIDRVIAGSAKLKGIFDGCHLFTKMRFQEERVSFAGIGRGNHLASDAFLDFVIEGFRIVEKGFANEIQNLIHFLNEKFLDEGFGTARFSEVQRLAKTCVTGCDLVDPEDIKGIPAYRGFIFRLAKCAKSTKSRAH